MIETAKVTVTLGEATYTLADDFNAFCDLEGAFGLNVNSIIKKLSNTATLGMLDVRLYLRTMLRADGIPVKPDVADAICQGLGMDGSNKAVSDHLLAHFAKD